jgi:uncharacterized membrane protein YoaK (UPF0700 family)
MRDRPRPAPTAARSTFAGVEQSGGTEARGDAGMLRRRELLVVALAVLSGATDAIGFLALGGAFTSVMTGNMVLLGIGIGQHDGSLVLHAAAALVAFAAGVAIGTRIVGQAREGDPVWPPAVTRALTVELALFVLFAIGWEAAGGAPEAELTQLLLLATTAVALGIQSGTILRFGVPGLSSTYLTGTLTSAVARLAGGRPVRDVVGNLKLLAGVIAGAAAGGLLQQEAPRFAPLLQLALLVAVLVGAWNLVSTGETP